MGLFLSIIGFFMVPIAITWLIFNFFKKRKKLLPSLSIVAGIIVGFSGLWMVGSNVTPEELAELEQTKQERAKAKLEKEELEKKEQAEKERKEGEQKQVTEVEKQKEIEEVNRKEKEELAKKEKELKEREQALKNHEQEKNKKKKEENTIFQPIVDIKDLAYKTESEIEEILGKPHESESGSLPLNGNSVKYKANYYDNGKFNVMFINDESTNIRISLNDEEYLDGNDIEKNVLYVELPVIDMSIDVAPDGQMFANSYSFEDIYRVEISRWRGSPGGFIFVILNEKYAF